LFGRRSEEKRDQDLNLRVPRREKGKKIYFRSDLFRVLGGVNDCSSNSLILELDSPKNEETLCLKIF
jgi:hypothetical protein